jgi:hypothetical protein
MTDEVADLVEVSQGRTQAGRETRNFAWLLLLQLARDGNLEARAAIADLCRTKRGNISNYRLQGKEFGEPVKPGNQGKRKHGKSSI